MGKLRSRIRKGLENSKGKFGVFLRSPMAPILLINSLIFAAWRQKGASNEFLTKHFSFDRENMRDSRFHTLVTYAFSHLSFIHFAFNMSALHFFISNLAPRHSSRTLWGLYLGGALSGGLSMNSFMPYQKILTPTVGADPAVSAMFSFFAIMNPLKPAFRLFSFPIYWGILLTLSLPIVWFVDPSRKNAGALGAGALLGLLVRGRSLML